MKVFPTHSYGGRQCYTFTTKKLRDAFRVLTGQTSASEKKLNALQDFGVRIEYETDSILLPQPTNAIQEPH